MINLRYHVVSLIAVFLALGMGIVMGSTVIDRVTVDALNNRLETVRRSVNGIRDENRKLADQARIGRDFSDETRDLLVHDQLVGVPVMIVAITGIDRKPVDSLRDAIVASGATVGGTVWALPRLRLDNEADVRALATALGLQPLDADTMRRLALARLVGDPSKDGNPAATLTALVAAGFVTFDPPPPVSTTSTTKSSTPTTTASATSSTPPSTVKSANGASAGTTVPPGGEAPSDQRSMTRYVIVSGAGAEVGDDLLAVPLAQALAATPGRGVAAEAGNDTPGGRGVYVGPLRADANVASRVSTVDNLETSMGQVATVIAIADLVQSRVGHYGVGPGANRLVPGNQ